MEYEDWKECSVDCIKSSAPNALATGPFGSAISSRHFVSTGTPVIRGSNLSQDVGVRLIDEGLVFIHETKAKEFSRSVAKRGDLVFTCWGTIDQVGLIDERSRFPEYVVSNKQMKLTPDPKKAHSLFLYYLFSGPDMRNRIVSLGIGSSVPGFNLGQLRSLSFRLPSLQEQKAIAGLLGSLDDRIELTRQMNQTLEAIAQALFRSWFIDFHPVRVKAEGRDPEGMGAETTKQFPGEFEQSELGPIPKGWRLGALGETAQNPRHAAKAEHLQSDVPYIGLEHMPRRSLSIAEYGFAEGLESNKFWFHKKDILFGKLRPYFHKVGIAPCTGVCSTDILVLRATQECFHGFLVMHASSVELVDYATRLSNGAKMPRTSWGDIAAYRIVLPPEAVADAFNQIAQPIFDRILGNIEHAKVLRGLRDTLLPRLISGQLRIPEAQEAIEEVLG